ncbi:MAG: sugar ABC transporter ATP-binding protein [Hyphomicrobiales bacterium]|nr:sugar ABC transporter ATP-binding protein [Hyphomicrobiales bacterium]
MAEITKRFFEVTALDNVNFDLKRGEIHALVGENGAGKSTLMKILSGSYSSSSYDGTIEVEGRRTNMLTTRDAEEAGIEMIYQEISLNAELSVAENIFLGRLPRAGKSFFIDWRQTNQLAHEALATVGLSVSPTGMVGQLSTSQQQMVAIAKALYRNPRILVLDEPTSALTDHEASILKKLITELKEKGISSIYISHRLDEVFEIADRVTVLRDGKLISTVDRERIDPDRIVEDMVGRKVETFFPKITVPIGDVALRVENLRVPSRIPGKYAVDGVSFDVRRGEILGLGGLVGSGRSEILNAIMGWYPSTVDRIEVQGSPVNIRSPQDSVKAKLGLVTEDRFASGLVSSINIRSNVSIASLSKISKHSFIQMAKERRQVNAKVSQLELKASSIEANITTLSGGNQQKVVLAKWLMTDVEVLLLDEPTRGIDVGAKVEVYNIIGELARQGVAVVLVTSDLPELLAMVDRCIVIRDGKAVKEFSGGEMTENSFMNYATGAHTATAQQMVEA